LAALYCVVGQDVLIESRLFRAADWEHYHWVEIDRLDDAAEKLFQQLLEP
jgi:hypothetical protein